MERQANTQTQQMAGAMAPRAPTPGHGVGSVPFSPGMVSGRLGPKPPPQGPPGPQVMPGGAPAPPPPSPSGPGPAPGGPPMSPMQGGGDPMLSPQVYFGYMSDLMKAIMGAYDRTAASGGMPWGY